ncbi:major capsid protein P2 [Marinomonas atlantica]|uniref:major capsid protein P2 n=1 Tax=Marinomonas atlantica TaxID=1806668 RepID=UPI00082B602E|nr:major capsid protein P2 [Marinomonas atlantica]
MSRITTDRMQSPDGSIASGNTLQLSMGNGYIYQALYLDTNIPASVLSKISVVNGSDDYLITSGSEIVNVLEKHQNRTVGKYIPIRFSDPDALLLDVQTMTQLVPMPSDAWLLKIELGTLPTENVPAGGWYLHVWREVASPIKAMNNGKGGLDLVRLVRKYERRFDRKVATSTMVGVNTFDKLIKGPNINIRRIYIKGDVSEIEFEGKRNGQIQHNWKVSKELCQYLQDVRAQSRGVQHIDGYFILDPIATGFAQNDLMVTNYDEISIKYKVETAGPVEFLTDYVKTV